jgi:hypothetical protein
MKKKNLILIIFIVVILIVLFVRGYKGRDSLLSGSATLSWSANTESDLAGYRVYYGQSPRTGDCPPGGYAEKAEAGKETNYKLEKLEGGRTYYFSVTSYNSAGKESCFSEEMQKTIENPIFTWFKKIFQN